MLGIMSHQTARLVKRNTAILYHSILSIRYRHEPHVANVPVRMIFFEKFPPQRAVEVH